MSNVLLHLEVVYNETRHLVYDSIHYSIPCFSGVHVKIKLTNRLLLPEAFVIAVANDPYDPDDGGQHSDFTITGLLKPPQMAELARTNEVVEDAADRLYSLQGQLIHAMLERAKPDLEAKGFMVEKRFYKKVIVEEVEYTVSAKIDVFDPSTGMLSDYKYTSVGAATRGLKDEHKWQVNFQAMLLREQGFTVNTMNATILMRDWSAERTYENYPISPVMLHTVPSIDDDALLAFISARIHAHLKAREQMPRCSDSERWKRDTYAAQKEVTSARATRVFSSKEEADAFREEKGGVVIKREGKPIRCLRYCPVKDVCKQFQEENVTPTVLDSDGFIKV